MKSFGLTIGLVCFVVCLNQKMTFGILLCLFNLRKFKTDSYKLYIKKSGNQHSRTSCISAHERIPLDCMQCLFFFIFSEGSVHMCESVRQESCAW